MRPAGEVRLALLAACGQLATAERGPTLREMAAVACVGLEAARRTVANMQRAGQLHAPRTRRVPYRNRPVAEYVPVQLAQMGHASEGASLAHTLRTWAS